MILLAFLIKFVAVLMLSLVAIAATTALLGNRVLAIQFFMGPVVYSAKLGHVAIRVGCLPIGGFVEPERHPYDDWSFWKSALSSLAGVAFLLATAAFLAGPGRTMEWLVTGMVKLLLGAWSPLAVGRYHVADGIAFLARASPTESLAGIAMMFTAFNLLPIPALPLGTLILRGIARAARLAADTVERIMVMGAMICLTGWILWIVAALAWMAGK
ncbi:site-2 protease family protein [Luteolibacter marinus]|uniref:site-2 protease family protein n=1 Tax=Luteolibacter marinus TaxID=2776705 RepID=UPI0018689FFD|nr:site-2 protease family protein [Luteolibacter marinus]